MAGTLFILSQVGDFKTQELVYKITRLTSDGVTWKYSDTYTVKEVDADVHQCYVVLLNGYLVIMNNSPWAKRFEILNKRFESIVNGCKEPIPKDVPTTQYFCIYSALS